MEVIWIITNMKLMEMTLNANENDIVLVYFWGRSFMRHFDIIDICAYLSVFTWKMIFPQAYICCWVNSAKSNKFHFTFCLHITFFDALFVLLI